MDHKYQNTFQIEALITIVDYSLGNSVAEIFQRYKLPINMITHGHGAANSEIYDILGFGEPKKAVIISIVTLELSRQIRNVLHSEMNLNKPGTGIAFSIPINSISSILSQLCNSSKADIHLESEEFPLMQSEAHDLIIAIVNNGYFNQLMDAAKEAGASGGTLIHARGIGTEEASKFLGITIQPERDIILILTSHEKKHNIMESIVHNVGLSTEAKGICFSLPVNSALGLGTHSV